MSDTSKENEKAPEDKDIEKILKTGTVSAGDGGSLIHCISIIGQIEGHYILDQTQKATKYEQLLPLLFSIEESPDVQGLLVLLNTMAILKAPSQVKLCLRHVPARLPW